jgi:hypothetical protein
MDEDKVMKDRMREIYSEYERIHKEGGRSNERIYRNFIRRKYYISRTTFYKYLKAMKNEKRIVSGDKESPEID